jgi:hypothetical protein
VTLCQGAFFGEKEAKETNWFQRNHNISPKEEEASLFGKVEHLFYAVSEHLRAEILRVSEHLFSEHLVSEHSGGKSVGGGSPDILTTPNKEYYKNYKLYNEEEKFTTSFMTNDIPKKYSTKKSE